jgi:hypothetical protein
MISVGGTFLALSMGIFIVNIYLNRDEKKTALEALFYYVAKSMDEFHDKLLDLMWTKFSKSEFNDVMNEYWEDDR